MGEAKRRAQQIESLKNKPREPRKRVKRTLGKAKTEQVYHFRSEAARRASGADSLPDVGLLRNSDEVTRLVKAALIEQQFVQAIPLKIFTPVVIEPTRQPRPPSPFPIVIGAKGEELAHFVTAMAQLTGGRGFRQPSGKAKNWQSTSLVEKLAIAFLGAEKNELKRSDRGEKKAKARMETNAVATLDRLIEQWPDRALQAKHDEKMRNWFAGKIQHAYPDVDELWLHQEIKERVSHPRHPKFWHAAQRRRAEQEELKAACPPILSY